MKMGMLRYFYCSAHHQDMSKSVLATLRKKTGYTFANCRKALEMNNNDSTKAEEWLKEQAKALGWKAALKVQNRQVSQGLIGVAIDNRKVAMVELNCETDFVSKNEKFKSLLELVTSTCLKYPVLNSGDETNQIFLNTEELGKLKAGNETLSDHTALLIGMIGENLLLKRAFCYETSRDDINLAISVHPPCNNSSVLCGRYGAFIAYQKAEGFGDATNEVSNELCKHIIGMNPSKIGDYENDKPSNDSDEETILIYQDFLSDETKTVGEYLKESGIKLVDFKRFECGEMTAKTEETKVNAEVVLN